MGFKGSVESFSLADVFQNLAMNQQTGTLRVYAGDGEEKYVFFQNGHVRYLSRGAKQPLLDPEVFYARGLVLKNQLENAQSRQKETNEPIGLCLIALGTITRANLNEIAKHQMEEEIFDLFGWDKAQFEFNEGAPPDGMFADQSADDGSAAGATLAISHLIMEAARRVDEWDRLRAAITNFKEIYSLELQARKSIENGDIDTDPVEKRVAALIDSARDIDDIIADSYLFKFEVMTALASFIHSQLVRPATLQELSFSEQECFRMQLPRRRIKVLERILAKGGENPRIRKELAELLAKEQQIEKACIHYSVLAEVEIKAKQEDAAVEFYKRIIAIAPKHVQAHEKLGAIYEKRGKKREAFIHYQEMYELFKDQNHPREARAAVSCALECDPTQFALRNELVELLLAENQKESASVQLEILGDQATKQGNAKLAAESYRRSMQYRPTNKQIKKKLADVMLTKEDRIARKRKGMAFLAGLVVAAIGLGVLGFKEYNNHLAFTSVMLRARTLGEKADDEDKNDQFTEAEQDYSDAAALYAPLENQFSPVLSLGEKARQKRSQLKDKAASMTGKASDAKDRLGRKSKTDLEAAENAKKQKHFDEAKELYTRVVKNTYASPEAKKSAELGNSEVQKIIDTFEDAMRQIQKEKEHPNEGFESVEKENEFKLNLVADFNGYPRLNASEIEFPILIKPNTDSVNIYIDGKLAGSVNESGTRASNTFRYLYGPHKFDFKKPGYKTVAIPTGAIHSPVLEVNMQREPAFEVDLRASLGETGFSGEAVFDDDSILVGATDGSLLQISVSQKKVLRKYEHKAPADGLSHEVYGPIYVQFAANKLELIVYATRAGECIGLKVEGGNLVPAWELKKIPDTGLSERPRPALLNVSGKPTLVIPLDKRLYLLDCETGILSKDLPEFKARIKSSPALGEQSLILAGGEDGQLYGMTIRRTVEHWTTGAGEATSLTGQPLFVDNRIVVGGNDGKLYWFDGMVSGAKTGELMLAAEILTQPLARQKRLYVGTSGFDAIWCVDPARRIVVWKQNFTNMGGVSMPGAGLDNRVYFGTDKGRLYALDAEKGNLRWMYEVDGGKGFACRPLIAGRRVLAITKDGRILGFDEQQE